MTAMPVRTQLANWAGNLTYGAVRVHRPSSLTALQRLVAETRHIRALGSRHSFSPVADTTHDLVVLDALPERVDIDPARRTATVAAGMSYGAVAATLDRAGFALPALASLPNISVAGACATGTHGSGRRCLAASVRALQLVGPRGELVEISRDDAPDDFPGAVVALGALGIVTQVTLDIEPTFSVAQRVRLAVPLEEVRQRCGEVLDAAYSVSVFTDFDRPEAQVWLKHRADQSEPGLRAGRPADTPQHPVPGADAGSCTAQLGLPGPWHERLPHFRADALPATGAELQSELYLPRHMASAAITALREMGERLAPVLQISEIRSVRADDLWLSPAYGRETVTFHFTWVDDEAAVAPVLAAVEERLVPWGGRPHWAKLTALAPRRVSELYPRAAEFAALRRRFDPDGKFGNAFVDTSFEHLTHAART